MCIADFKKKKTKNIILKQLIMKINKFLALAFGLVTMLLVNSCVEDDDYTVPEVLVPAVDISTLGTRTTFASVISRFEDAEANGDDIGTWEFDAPLYIEGYVVSSDATGNFFEEILIQNSPDENDLADDPRRGLRIEINVRDVSNFYNYGRKVYVKLNGLAVGESSGVLTLGKLTGDALGQLEAFEYKNFVIRDPEVATIIPKTVAISDLSEQDENTLVKITDAQFIKSAIENTNSYAGEASDSFDGFRTIKNCESGATITLQTSTFADFKSFPLAPGKGDISAIFSRDFGDDFNVLVINNVESVNFTNEERCDPFDINDFDIVFEEDFTDGLTGWEVFNTSGSTSWFAGDFGSDFYARGSAFSGGSIVQMVSWLISPTLNFDAQDDEQMVLQIADAFSNGAPLTAYYSNDYVAGSNPSAATWIEIGADEILALPENTGFFDNEFDETGLIDLAAVTGNAVIAFVYDSNNATVSTTIDLGNVKILSPQ